MRKLNASSFKSDALAVGGETAPANVISAQLLLTSGSEETFDPYYATVKWTFDQAVTFDLGASTDAFEVFNSYDATWYIPLGIVASASNSITLEYSPADSFIIATDYIRMLAQPAALLTPCNAVGETDIYLS